MLFCSILNACPELTYRPSQRPFMAPMARYPQLRGLGNSNKCLTIRQTVFTYEQYNCSQSTSEYCPPDASVRPSQRLFLQQQNNHGDKFSRLNKSMGKISIYKHLTFFTCSFKATYLMNCCQPTHSFLFLEPTSQVKFFSK